MNQEEYNEILEEIIGMKVREISDIFNGLNNTQILDPRERIMAQLSVLTSVCHMVFSEMYRAGVNEDIDKNGKNFAWKDVTKILHAVIDNDKEAITLLQAQHKVRSIG